MPTGELIAILYCGAGVLVAVALAFWLHRTNGWKPRISSMLLWGESYFIPLFLVVLTWPLILLGILICWFDGRSSGEKTDTEK